MKKNAGRKPPAIQLRYKRVLYRRAWIMAILTVALALLGLWQRDFVMAGVTANPYLNLTILAGLVFGVSLTFYQLFEMRDDFTALDGLYEALNDVRATSESHTRAAGMRERDDRLKRPAILFSPPRLLGSGYLLLSQEIARLGVLSISNSTKKLLLDEIEERIDVRTNFSGYVGSLMVLLGLLGTFIGLMETVGSVGTIISELDLSGSAGSGAIQKLISNLRAPLNGMATGFSSSLFGLIASLMIGVLGRVVGTAYNAMRSDFEHWMNQVARIESDGDTQPTPVPAASSANDPDADFASALRASEEQLLWRTVRSSIAAQAGLRDQISNLIATTVEDRAARKAEMDLLHDILHRNDLALAEQRAALAAILGTPAAMTKAADTLSSSVDDLRRTVDRRGANRPFSKTPRPADTGSHPSRKSAQDGAVPTEPKDTTMDDWIKATSSAVAPETQAKRA